MTRTGTISRKWKRLTRGLCLLFLNVGVSVAGDNELSIPTKWLPSHPQNGQEVTAVVKLHNNMKNPFKDTRSGKITYENKATVLRQNNNGDDSDHISIWLYLRTTNCLPSNVTLRVTGTLSISEHQVKGGEYPATIKVQSWEDK